MFKPQSSKRSYIKLQGTLPQLLLKKEFKAGAIKSTFFEKLMSNIIIKHKKFVTTV